MYIITLLYGVITIFRTGFFPGYVICISLRFSNNKNRNIITEKYCSSYVYFTVTKDYTSHTGILENNYIKPNLDDVTDYR